MAANDFNNNFENIGDAGGGAVGNGASVDTDSILFLKNIKYTSEELSNITTNSQLEKILGVKNLILKDWWINEDKYLCFSLTPSFKKDVVSYVKFKDKNDVSYYLDVEDNVASSFPYHKKTYEEAMKTDTINVSNKYIVQQTMYAYDASAIISVKISGSLPEINKLISYNSMSGIISGTITYSSNMTMIRESFTKSFSISNIQDSWSTRVTITTNDVCDVDSAIVSISSCSTTLNYTSWVENNIVYYLGLSEVGYAIKSINGYLWNGEGLEDKIKSQPIYIDGTITTTTKTTKTTSSTPTTNYIDNYNSTVKPDALKLVSKVTKLGHYYAKNRSFQILSFKSNSKNENSKDKQYVFQSNQGFFSNVSTPNYWTTFPQAYPEIITNNMFASSPSSASVSIKSNSSVSNGTKTWNIYANDLLVVYIRKPGTLKIDSINPGWSYNEINNWTTIYSRYKVEIEGAKNNATLECDPVKCYIIPINKNHTVNFDFSDIDGLDSLTNSWTHVEQSSPLYNIVQTSSDLVHTYSIVGHDEDHKSEWALFGPHWAFASIGKYSWSEPDYGGSWGTIKLSTEATFSLKLTVKNLQYVGNSVDKSWSLSDSSVSISLSGFSVAKGSAYANINMWGGILPKSKLSFWGDIGNDWPSGSQPQGTHWQAREADCRYRWMRGQGQDGSYSSYYQSSLEVVTYYNAGNPTYVASVVLWRNGKELI